MNAMNLAIALSYIDPKYIEECKHNMLVKKATWIFCPICGSKTRTKVYEIQWFTTSRCTAPNAKPKSGSILHN